jgi:hypothetical protein
MDQAMVTPRLTVLGRRVRLLERIPVVGDVLGLGSRSTAYRLAEADNWPLVGPESSRWVLMIPLLERYSIPYEVESDGAASEGAE